MEAKVIDYQVTLNKLCSELEGAIRAQPDASNLVELSQWYANVHATLAAMATARAFVEAEFAKESIDVMQQLDADEFKLIKGSTTLVTNYLAGKLPRYHYLLQRAEHLTRVAYAALDDLRTLIVSIREEKAAERKGLQ